MCEKDDLVWPPQWSPVQHWCRAPTDRIVPAEDALSSHLLLMEAQRCNGPPAHPPTKKTFLWHLLFSHRTEPEHPGPAAVTQQPAVGPWQQP